jgi:hypothetical protein
MFRRKEYSLPYFERNLNTFLATIAYKPNWHYYLSIIIKSERYANK